ncbi:MAG TPA: hypothetical protein VHG93_08810, partial [Longimicrobium sp.]|nr:hypothetical protein [Longimicrobium sp.]
IPQPVANERPTTSALERVQRAIAGCDETSPEEEVLKRLDLEFGSGPLYGKRWYLPVIAAAVVLGLGGWFARWLLSLPIPSDAAKITQPPYSDNLRWALQVYAIWIVLVPLWFLAEHAFFVKGQSLPTRRDRFRYNQELAQKFWAAVVLIFGILILIKFRIQVF